MAFVVEVVSRSGRLLERHRFASDSATVGRGYDNDLILADPYMEPRHARLFATGTGVGLVVASANGRTLLGRTPVNDRIEFDSGSIVTLGHTRLRLLSSGHSVEPSLTLHFVDELFARLAEPAIFALGFAIYISLAGLQAYTNTFREVELTDFVVGLVQPLLAWLAYVCVWALVSRVFRHEPRFFYHCWAVLIYLVIGMIGGWIIQVIVFNTNDLQMEYWLTTALDGVALLVLLALNLRFAFQLSDHHRRLFATGLSLAVVGYSVLNEVADAPKVSMEPAYSSTTLPRSFLFRSGAAPEAFVNDAQVIFDFSEELAEHARESRESTKKNGERNLNR